jgi:xanthine dehydrogenase YagS FAD-binding subunit
MGRNLLVRALLETSGLQPLAGPAGTAFAASVGGMAGQVATPN